MWRVYKEAGRPWPTLSDDDVIDYMVMEAVYLKYATEEEKKRVEAEKAAKRKKFREDTSDLDQYR